MGGYEISALPWNSRQRIFGWNFKEFWQVSGSAVINGSFHNQFEWAPCTNGYAAERGTSRPWHRWHRLCLGCTSWVRKIEHWCWANLSVWNKLWVGLKEFTPLFLYQTTVWLNSLYQWICIRICSNNYHPQKLLHLSDIGWFWPLAWGRIYNAGCFNQLHDQRPLFPLCQITFGEFELHIFSYLYQDVTQAPVVLYTHSPEMNRVRLSR